jgi:hypothetical protein
MAVDDKILSEQDLGLSGMGGLGSLKSEEGIPYKTSQEVVPLSEGGGYFYGTSATPSQRFIFRKIMTDAEGNPQKLFENFNTLDDIEKQFIAESDQRREELTPEEISTLDMLKEAGIITGAEVFKPVAKAGLQTLVEGGTMDAAKDAAKGALPFVKSDAEISKGITDQFTSDYTFDANASATISDTLTAGQKDALVRSGDAVEIKLRDGSRGYAVDPNSVTGKDFISQGSATYGNVPPGAGVAVGSPGSMNPNVNSPNYTSAYDTQKAIGGAPKTGTSASTGGFFSGGSIKARYDQAFKTETLGTNFAVDFAVNLALGSGKPKERIEAAAKSAAGSTIGTAIGTTIGGPVGGFIGGTIGSVVASGSVICSELYRQKLITKEDYFINLRFTRSHLIPQRGYSILQGYWFMAIPVVKIMRKNKTMTRIWKHIFQKRTSDLKWRLGKGKFNLLGRVYSLIFENTCAVLGKFCNEQDYQILYKEKANG